MKTLTEGESSDWLRARGIVEDPYGRALSWGQFYCQLRLPASYAKVAAVRALVSSSLQSQVALLRFVDWQPEPYDQMAVVESVRALYGDRRQLLDSPAHCFAADEQTLLIGLATLLVFYCWSAYLYVEGGPTLYLWEGEIVDAWATEPVQMSRIEAAASSLGLKETSPRQS